MAPQLFLSVDAESLLPEAVDEIPAALASVDEATRDRATAQFHNRLCEALCETAKSKQLRALLKCATDCVGLMPVVKLVKARVFELAMDPDGCRLVQAALQVASRTEQAELAKEMKGHVCEMVTSPHANHVLQRLIELMPPSAVTFVLEEMAARWSPDYVAKHKFGCRVFERILEHFPLREGSCEALSTFLDRLLLNAEEHCFHSMATFILQHLLEHGSGEHKRKIVAAVRANLERVALDSHASGVLDKALTLTDVEEQQSLASQVLMLPGLLCRMAHANRPAAARLLLLAQGWQLSEAHRQVCLEFPESAQRIRMLHSLFGCKSPPPALSELFSRNAECAMAPPVPQMMEFGDGVSDSFVYVAPPQEAMAGSDWYSEAQDAAWAMPYGQYMWTG